MLDGNVYEKNVLANNSQFDLKGPFLQTRAIATVASVCRGDPNLPISSLEEAMVEAMMGRFISSNFGSYLLEIAD